MKQTDSAYLAGLIDGEGCLRVGMNASWANPSITVCMTTPAPLRWAQRVTGVGGIHTRQDKRVGRRRVCYWYVTKGEDILRILRMIRPWLIVKIPDAHVLSAFLLLKGRPGHRRLHPVADAHLVRLSTLVKKADLSPAYEEALDLVAYLRQAIEEREA